MESKQPAGETEGTRTRKHLYLITDHPDESTVGKVEARDTRYARPEKNTESTIDLRNTETGEAWTEKRVGLGYVDFESEADYQENWVDAVMEKLAEVDREHLERAGLHPDEVTP